MLLSEKFFFFGGLASTDECPAVKKIQVGFSWLRESGACLCRHRRRRRYHHRRRLCRRRHRHDTLLKEVLNTVSSASSCVEQKQNQKLGKKKKDVFEELSFEDIFRYLNVIQIAF